MAAAAPADVAEQEAFDTLCAWTLSRGDEAFVHQHAVDAWTAQRADSGTKPIAIAFALVGLCLHIERGLSGREVQRIHMKLARRRKDWPEFALPKLRGEVTVRDVLMASEGEERDAAIDDWCASVWAAYASVHGEVTALLARELDGG